MPIRTAPITPEQRAELDELLKQYWKALAEADRYENEWRVRVTEIFDGDTSPELESTLVTALVSEDGNSLDLVTAAPRNGIA